jgi:hypothetical protein
VLAAHRSVCSQPGVSEDTPMDGTTRHNCVDRRACPGGAVALADSVVWMRTSGQCGSGCWTVSPAFGLATRLWASWLPTFADWLSKPTPDDPALRDAFEEQWARIDGELELRTESWAPAGSASDADLARYLDGREQWVSELLRSSSSTAHE